MRGVLRVHTQRARVKPQPGLYSEFLKSGGGVGNPGFDAEEGPIQSRSELKRVLGHSDLRNGYSPSSYGCWISTPLNRSSPTCSQAPKARVCANPQRRSEWPQPQLPNGDIFCGCPSWAWPGKVRQGLHLEQQVAL